MGPALDELARRALERNVGSVVVHLLELRHDRISARQVRVVYRLDLGVLALEVVQSLGSLGQ
jgi:hypothetical protein